MNEPVIHAQTQTLEPVHAGEEDAPTEIWAPRLVQFMRLMACVALLKGLMHWAVVCGFEAETPAAFSDYATSFQAATVFFAVIDLVAAVGLWLAAPWGAVVWLTAVISMIAVELLFPQIYGGRLWLAGLGLLFLIAYLLLAIMAAREVRE
jgi:hypothetical protein